jgi:hypothetical protein
MGASGRVEKKVPSYDRFNQGSRRRLFTLFKCIFILLLNQQETTTTVSINN